MCHQPEQGQEVNHEHLTAQGNVVATALDEGMDQATDQENLGGNDVPQVHPLDEDQNQRRDSDKHRGLELVGQIALDAP